MVITAFNINILLNKIVCTTYIYFDKYESIKYFKEGKEFYLTTWRTKSNVHESLPRVQKNVC